MLASEVQPGDQLGTNPLTGTYYYRVISTTRNERTGRIVFEVQYFDGGMGAREFHADQEIEWMVRP